MLRPSENRQRDFLVRRGRCGLFVTRGQFPFCRAASFDQYEINGVVVSFFVSVQSLPLTAADMRQAKRIIAALLKNGKQRAYELLDKEWQP